MGFSVAKNLGHNSLEDDERGFDICRNFVGATIGRPLFSFIAFLGRQNASPTEFDIYFCRGGVSPPAFQISICRGDGVNYMATICTLL